MQVNRVSWSSMRESFSVVHDLARTIPNALEVFNSPTATVDQISAQVLNLRNFSNKVSLVFGDEEFPELATLNNGISDALRVLEGGGKFTISPSYDPTYGYKQAYTPETYSFSDSFVFSGTTSGWVVTAPFMTPADKSNFLALIDRAVRTPASSPMPTMTTSSGVVITLTPFVIQWNGYQSTITFTNPATNTGAGFFNPNVTRDDLAASISSIKTAIIALQHAYFGG